MTPLPKYASRRVAPRVVAPAEVKSGQAAARIKYKKLRRFLGRLKRTIRRELQGVVFEPNGAELWAGVRGRLEDLLWKKWQSGALPGAKPEEAFFVRCDRTTMTQADLDNGRLVCLVGVALLRPAEFVILRIGQWTADRKC
jgi:phage tail sheath protein FI